MSWQLVIRPEAESDIGLREGGGAGGAEAGGAVGGKEVHEPITGEVFLPVPAGRFEMGGTAHDDEKPIQWVRLSPFWLARTPVTNRQGIPGAHGPGYSLPPLRG